jgi:ATP-dependent DNA helicase RecG
MNFEQLLEALKLGEDSELEFKAAQGGLPKSVWETVSAFANADGGTIILGIVERDGEWVIEGIRKPGPLLKIFWDTHNNPQKLNYPVCQESNVSIVSIAGQKLISIFVPRASRQKRPIYINGNPLSGTFKRNFEGDYRCNETEVRAMLREASDEPLDGQILEGFK